MVDKVSPEKRSEIMSKIRSKNTKIEKIVFSYLRKNNIYFQRHYTRAIGNPDIALPRKKKAVFIDGDFWHGYTFERRKDSLPGYWVQKIIRNVKRDKKNRALLKEQGWQILRIWEHELNRKNQEATLRQLTDFLKH